MLTSTSTTLNPRNINYQSSPKLSYKLQEEDMPRKPI